MNTHQTRLESLDARRPLDFLAALGAFTAASDRGHTTLRFDNTTPIIAPHTIHQIARSAIDAYQRLATGPAANPINIVGKPNTVKFDLNNHNGTRCYLRSVLTADPHTLRLATALAPEGATQTTKPPTAKPYAFDFTAGRQQFLRIVREIAPEDPDTITTALTKPHSGLTRLRWGHTDGRTHARYAGSPSDKRYAKNSDKDPALTALAVLGTSLFPSWATPHNKAATQNFPTPPPAAAQQSPAFVWPLWEPPVPLPVCQSLLAAVRADPTPASGLLWTAWGITRVFAATTRRDAHGGGTFANPEMVW